MKLPHKDSLASYQPSQVDNNEDQDNDTIEKNSLSSFGNNLAGHEPSIDSQDAWVSNDLSGLLHSNKISLASPCIGVEGRESLKKDLRNWANCHNITLSALSDLTFVLSPYVNESLPRDARTLKGSERKLVVKSLSNGEYFHFGLRRGI